MLDRAHATLVAGCDFVSGEGLDGAVPPSPFAHRVHDRMTANRLRELDRFLSVLLEEVAHLLGGPRHDGAHFARASNSSKKLRLVEAMAGLPSEDHVRLRAIGRIAARLRHGGSHRHAASLAGDFLLASGHEPSDPRPGAEGHFRLSPDVIRSVSAFYRAIGDRLMLYTVHLPG